YAPGNFTTLMRVAATGGKPQRVLPLEGDERSHRWPRFLPGGRRFLFEVRRPNPTAGAPMVRATFVGSLDSQEKQQVLSADTSLAYVPPGYLLFGRAKNLMVVACDPKTLEPRGEPLVLASGVGDFPAPGSPFFSVTENLIVFWTTGNPLTRLVWLDRSGREMSTIGDPGSSLSFALTRDGRTAVASLAQDPMPPDLWLIDAGVGRGIRLTRDAMPQLIPVISPDGRRIFFSAYSRAPWDIWETSPQAGAEMKPFLESEMTKTANDISPDGRWLLYREFSPATLGDLKVVALEGERKPRTLVGTVDDETNGTFSSDGRWIAYTSDESGRKEVSAASFPDAAQRLRVTTEGGSQPRWSRDGKELFYIASGQLVAVPVESKGDQLIFGQHRPLFRLP